MKDASGKFANGTPLRLSADPVARLRVLTQDHREGRLNLKAYRKLRGQLLDALDSGPPPDFQCTTDANLLAPPRDLDEIPVPIPRVPGAATRQDRRPSRWFRAVAIAAASGLLAAAAGIVWRTYEKTPVLTHAPDVRENAPKQPVD
jgi:hypothetical protein